MNKLRLTGRGIPKKEEQTFNPYPLKGREVVGSEAWIFTERLKFTDGVSNDPVSDWEKHLISAYHAHLAAVTDEEMILTHQEQTPSLHTQKVGYGDVTVAEIEWDIDALLKAQLAKAIHSISQD